MRSKISKIGIIGGSGAEDLIISKGFKQKTVRTKYGEIKVKVGKIGEKTVVLLKRHGEKYLPPSLINYRGNIAVLKQEGADYIIASAAVGAINRRMKPGDFLTLADFIDFTRGRIETFSPASFIDLSEPYNSVLNQKIADAAGKLRIRLHKNAVYVCTEGPRFETRAEIRMYGRSGADVVGMTNVPEVVLAAEAGIPYAVIGVVTNYAAGVSPKRVSAEEVVGVVASKKESFSEIIRQVINLI